MRSLFTLLSPAGTRARLTVLIFHRVLPAPDPLFPEEVDAERFDQVCSWMARWFQVMPLPQAVQALGEERLPARAACITFDDGYADNHDVAMPILQRHGLTATFFIATGFLDGGVMWNDRLIEAVRRTPAGTLDLVDCGLPGIAQVPVHTLEQRRAAIGRLLDAAKYLPVADRAAAVERVVQAAGSQQRPLPMMRSAQVQALHAAGMTIGAHTVSHPILARLSPAEAASEIVASKQHLEALLQSRVSVFAYPNGRPVRDYVGASVDAVRAAGFDAAVTTAAGAAASGTDPLQIPRFTPWDQGKAAFGMRLAKLLATRRGGKQLVAA